jgi:hypothetical protein
MNKKDGIYMPSFNKNILNIIKIIANIVIKGLMVNINIKNIVSKAKTGKEIIIPSIIIIEISNGL